MFKKILLGLVVIVVAFLGYVAMQPDDYRVSRSTKIKAPPAAVFAQVNDFHNWDAWSPWIKLDPNAKVSFEGPTSGTGAVFRWAGNNEVGEGSMTITESKPNELIRIKLDFLKPMADTATTEFTFKPEGDQTDVTWAMFGTKTNFLGKAVCTVMGMEKMVGEKYAEGLASLKRVVEKGTAK